MSIFHGRPLNIVEAVSRAYGARMQLHLNREDIAFVAGIHVYIEIQQNFSLELSDLEKVYNIVNEVTHGKQDLVSQRCQSATERLLKNQLLIRVDGGGISHRPVYDITQLGRAIIDFMSNSETLTRQNLTIITSRIIGFLAEIRKSLETSGSEAFWEEKVLMPLGCVVAELLEAIEKRQKGLDLEQGEVRTRISELLEKEWLAALESCESLLGTTSATLQELYRTLLSESTVIKQGLNEIYEQAEQHDQPQVLTTIEHIFSRLEHLEQWGRERVASWSQYYRRVNDFLQSMVRFDPNRELSQRLQEQLRTFPQHPWFLEVIEPQVYRGIREIDLVQKKKRVVRTLPEHPDSHEVIDDDGNLVLDLIVDDLKDRLKKDQPLDLIEILLPYFQQHPLDKIYPHIGTLIDMILKEGKHQPERNPQWATPIPELEMQNLTTRLLELSKSEKK